MGRLTAFVAFYLTYPRVALSLMLCSNRLGDEEMRVVFLLQVFSTDSLRTPYFATKCPAGLLTTVIMKAFLLLPILTLSLLSSGQHNAKGDWFLLGAGYGYKYFDRDLQGFNFGGGYNFVNKKNKFYKRLSADVTFRPTYVRSLWNFNYSFGLMHKGRVAIPYICVGPGFMVGRRMDNTIVPTIGLSGSIGMSFRVLRDLAVGAELFTNANFIQSTHGFRVTLMGTQKN